jgi:two-component system, OmpR family, sensor histidine kinase KdpD
MQSIGFFLRKGRSLLPAVLSILSTLAVTALLVPLRGDFELAIIVLLFMLPVGFSAALGGFLPGVASALVSFLLLNYFFIPPYGSLLVHHPQHILVLVGFLVLTIGVSRLVGRMKDSLTMARARENETKRLYELSLALSGLQNEEEILNNLARHVTETFQTKRVEISLENTPSPELVSWPAGPGPQTLPTAVTSLQGTQHLLGEIRLWRAERPLNPTEERLLLTFASQGALALERTRLALAATRTRILEESDQMKGALLSSVSHELRTPLATIKASVTSLRDDTVEWNSEARADLLAAIDEETDNLNQLVGNLLNMSRIEAGALKLEYEWNDLSEIVAVALKRARLASPSHRFEIDLPDDLPLIFVDDALMEQVFKNLFSNSIKYSPAGSVIKVQARPRGADTLWVSVVNQSPAVPEESLEHIFEKFRRVTAADKITGTGLGLSICKGIIEAHKGRIWAENLPEGFSIQFTLPLQAGGKPASLPEP